MTRTFVSRRCRTAIAVLAALAVTPANALATWSVIAVDRETGRLVIASATCVLQANLERFPAKGLMDVQAIVVPGVGVAAAQAGVDRTRANQTLIYQELKKGTHPSAILQMLMADSSIQSRQFGMVDLQGRFAGFSGARNRAASLDVQGQVPGTQVYYSIQGNILASNAVVQNAVRAFESTTGPLTDRVMAAMEAADGAGGDGRCTCESTPVPTGPCTTRTAHVAYLLEANRTDPEGMSFNDGQYSLYLNVTDQNITSSENVNPVITLRMRYDAWKRTQGGGAAPPAQTPRQTEADAYTRYELLEPGSAKFRILYEVTATTPGATHYFNPIRKGSIATDERVIDRATGQPLVFDIVGYASARAGGVRVNDTTQTYIRVKLARPVSANGGEARVLIDKTYEDATSYYSQGDVIVFNRPLGIKRNAVVLPPGYELVSCNFPSQVIQEADGRIAISFWNPTPSEAPLLLRARPAPAISSANPAKSTLPALVARLDERAHQNREIVYFLQPPETHSFDLYHDYTESRAGTSHYLNVVRAGSAVSKPSARNLDTGEELKWEILKGEAITKAGLDVRDVTPQTEVVVFRFPAVKAGESVRLRMAETYTDTARYKLVGDELVWDRGFGRPANAVVLPPGWMLTNSSIPATVSQTPDGRVRLDFINPRPDEIAVLITARRRE